MPNLEVRCSSDIEALFLENDGALLRKLHTLLKNHESLDPVTEEPKKTVLRGRVATTLATWKLCFVAMKKVPANGSL
jgi:hypothetical protein